MICLILFNAQINIIHFIIHALFFSHLSIIEFNLKIVINKVNLVPYQKSLDIESINCVGVIFKHSELKFTNVRMLAFIINVQYCTNNIGPCCFTVASKWPKSCHDIGP